MGLRGLGLGGFGLGGLGLGGFRPWPWVSASAHGLGPWLRALAWGIGLSAAVVIVDCSDLGLMSG